MSYLIITNCTGRKSAKPRAKLDRTARLSKTKSLEDTANNWVEKIMLSDEKMKAKDLYQGRTIVDTKACQKRLNADVLIVSAGLGLVNFEDLIPSYELTVSENSSFASNLREFNYTTRDWWSLLNKSQNKGPNPICSALNNGHYKRILVSLPSSYLEMIGDDLWSANPNQIGKILVFTSAYGSTFIPKKWRHLVLPYDDRLQDPMSGFAGTRSDFPQRAMRHFVCEINLLNVSINKITNEINARLSLLNQPTAPKRKKISDSELLKLINKNWKKYHGQTTKILRFLRDQALISCEQSRFNRLCMQIKGKPNAKSQK